MLKALFDKKKKKNRINVYLSEKEFICNLFIIVIQYFFSDYYHKCAIYHIKNKKLQNRPKIDYYSEPFKARKFQTPVKKINFGKHVIIKVDIII